MQVKQVDIFRRPRLSVPSGGAPCYTPLFLTAGPENVASS